MKVKGKTVDDNTRCEHYHSHLDIIAIKFKCCDEYYPCYKCHAEDAGHAVVKWQKEEQEHKAILCGICRTELSIVEYFASENKCPYCHSHFNPNCSLHYSLYFEI